MRRSRLLDCAWLLVAGALALGGCHETSDEGAREGGQRPDQEIDGFTLTQTSDGKRLWSLRADRALVYEEADRVETIDIRVDFYDESGDVRSTLTANEGLLLRRTNDMEAIGNVVVQASDGAVLSTEHLRWNEMSGRIETDLYVRVRRDDDVMTGVGLEADPDLTNIRVKSEFHAYVRDDDGSLVEEK